MRQIPITGHFLADMRRIRPSLMRWKCRLYRHFFNISKLIREQQRNSYQRVLNVRVGALKLAPPRALHGGTDRLSAGRNPSNMSAMTARHPSLDRTSHTAGARAIAHAVPSVSPLAPCYRASVAVLDSQPSNIERSSIR
jgi:hypothetical protein